MKPNNEKIYTFVLTGPPSAGKTSVLKKIQEKIININIFEEVSREIIKTSLDTNSDVLPWKNAKAFDRVVIEQRDKDYKQTDNLISTTSGFKIKLLDRSSLDTYAYSLQFDCLEENTIQICRKTKPDLVFMFPYIEEIFTNDEERKESPELAKELQRSLIMTHKEFNIDTYQVPFDTIENRAELIISEIEKRLNTFLDRKIN